MNKDKAEVLADWSISLDAECPKCEHYFDLIRNNDDFWCSGMGACEHDTPKTNRYEAICPECKHEFEVCFVY